MRRSLCAAVAGVTAAVASAPLAGVGDFEIHAGIGLEFGSEPCLASAFAVASYSPVPAVGSETVAEYSWLALSGCP